MSERFKIVYTEKRSGSGEPVSYNCAITDQETNKIFNGIGKTKEDAKEDAWEEFDELNTQQSENPYTSLPITYGLVRGKSNGEVSDDADEDHDDDDDFDDIDDDTGIDDDDVDDD